MSINSVVTTIMSKGIMPTVRRFGKNTALTFAHNGKQYTQLYNDVGQLIKYKRVDGAKVVKGTIDRSVNGTHIEKVTKSPLFTDVSIMDSSKFSNGRFISRVNNNESVIIGTTRDNLDNLLVNINKTQSGFKSPTQDYVIDKFTGKKLLTDDAFNLTDDFSASNLFRQNILDNYQTSTLTNDITTQEISKSKDLDEGILGLLGLGTLLGSGGLMFKPKAPNGYTVKRLIGNKYSVAVNNGNFGAKVMSASEYKNWLKQMEGVKA